MIKVEIVESEHGWGQRIDSTEEFKTQEEVDAFIKEFNAKNNKDTVPDWYMYARQVGPRDKIKI